jgi:hypothetical protein
LHRRESGQKCRDEGHGGFGGRCSAGEAAKDAGKKAAGVEEKGPIEKQKKKNDTPAEKAKDAVTK